MQSVSRTFASAPTSTHSPATMKFAPPNDYRKSSSEGLDKLNVSCQQLDRGRIGADFKLLAAAQASPATGPKDPSACPLPLRHPSLEPTPLQSAQRPGRHLLQPPWFRSRRPLQIPVAVCNHDARAFAASTNFCPPIKRRNFVRSCATLARWLTVRP